MAVCGLTYSEKHAFFGRRVSTKEGKIGTVRYIGSIISHEGTWCGIEFDEPIGENNGIINDLKYFCCKPNCGTFVPINEVLRSKSDCAKKKHSTSCCITTPRLSLGNKPNNDINISEILAPHCEKRVNVALNETFDFSKKETQNFEHSERFVSEESLGILSDIIDSPDSSWESFDLLSRNDNWNKLYSKYTDVDKPENFNFLNTLSPLQTIQIEAKDASTPKYLNTYPLNSTIIKSPDEVFEPNAENGNLNNTFTSPDAELLFQQTDENSRKTLENIKDKLHLSIIPEYSNETSEIENILNVTFPVPLNLNVTFEIKNSTMTEDNLIQIDQTGSVNDDNSNNSIFVVGEGSPFTKNVPDSDKISLTTNSLNAFVKPSCALESIPLNQTINLNKISDVNEESYSLKDKNLDSDEVSLSTTIYSVPAALKSTLEKIPLNQTINLNKIGDNLNATYNKSLNKENETISEKKLNSTFNYTLKNKVGSEVSTSKVLDVGKANSKVKEITNVEKNNLTCLKKVLNPPVSSNGIRRQSLSAISNLKGVNDGCNLQFPISDISKRRYSLVDYDTVSKISSNPLKDLIVEKDQRKFTSALLIKANECTSNRTSKICVNVPSANVTIKNSSLKNKKLPCIPKVIGKACIYKGAPLKSTSNAKDIKKNGIVTNNLNVKSRLPGMQSSKTSLSNICDTQKLINKKCELQICCNKDVDAFSKEVIVLKSTELKFLGMPDKKTSISSAASFKNVETRIKNHNINGLLNSQARNFPTTYEPQSNDEGKIVPKKRLANTSTCEEAHCSKQETENTDKKLSLGKPAKFAQKESISKVSAPRNLKLPNRSSFLLPARSTETSRIKPSSLDNHKSMSSTGSHETKALPSTLKAPRFPMKNQNDLALKQTKTRRTTDVAVNQTKDASLSRNTDKLKTGTKNMTTEEVVPNQVMNGTTKENAFKKSGNNIPFVKSRTSGIPQPSDSSSRLPRFKPKLIFKPH